MEGPKNDHFGPKKKKKNGRLRDFHKSEKVNILVEKKEKKSTQSGRSEKLPFLGKKKKKKKKNLEKKKKKS